MTFLCQLIPPDCVLIIYTFLLLLLQAASTATAGGPGTVPYPSAYPGYHITSARQAIYASVHLPVFLNPFYVVIIRMSLEGDYLRPSNRVSRD